MSPDALMYTMARARSRQHSDNDSCIRAREADLDASSSYASSSNFDEKVVSDLNPGITVDGAEVFEVSKELFDVATWSARVVTDDGNLWFNLR